MLCVCVCDVCDVFLLLLRMDSPMSMDLSSDPRGAGEQSSSEQFDGKMRKLLKVWHVLVTRSDFTYRSSSISIHFVAISSKRCAQL
jgi:hypothetical protein